MGLPPAEVAAGVREVLADRGLVVRVDEAVDGVSTFSLAGVVIRVSPLPKGRPTALRFHPRLPVAARARGLREIETLRRLGVNRLADPEAEASFELARHALQRMGVSGPELNGIISGLRRDVYGRPGD